MVLNPACFAAAMRSAQNSGGTRAYSIDAPRTQILRPSTEKLCPSYVTLTMLGV